VISAVEATDALNRPPLRAFLAQLERITMKRHIQFLVFALACGMFGGCATVGSTSAIATP
jgi:hypothetical protein